MTRGELYELVWQEPMTKLSKRFGMSDVGLRKLCHKHGIPTPPLGFWAKRAHGKPVQLPPLPQAESGCDVPFPLAFWSVAEPPAEVVAEQDVALVGEQRYPAVVVSEERSARLHPVASETAKALRSAKMDHEGFKTCSAPGGIAVSVGPKSVDRVLRIVDAFARALEDRGYRFAGHKEGVRILVDEIPVSWRIHETRDKTEHKPTKKELERQAEEEEWRAGWPRDRASDRKVYRSWDYFPSGRLAMTLTDATRHYWHGEGKLGSWYDRKARFLEECLDDAMKALAVGAVQIRHCLAEEAEQARRKAEAAERRRLEQARRERAMRRHEFLLKKSEDFARFEKLSALAEHMRGQRQYCQQKPVDHLIDELEVLIKTSAEAFDRETLAGEIQSLGLYEPKDLESVSGDDEEDV